MTDDNIKEGSGLPEDESSPADRRFDVFENVDYSELADEKKSEAYDPVDISLDDLLGELDAISAEADAGTDESAGKTADFSDLAGATRRDRSKSDASGSGGFDASFVSPESAPASSGSAPSGSKEKGSGAAARKEGSDTKKEKKDPLSDTGTIEFTRGEVRRPGSEVSPRAPSNKTFSQSDVDRAAKAITDFIEQGKLSSALDLVLCLRGAFRQAVREKTSVTVPLGSRDADLRRIAAGALIQSYLEQGKIVRKDIENKLYAIIESSEPEYDDNDEVVEQTDEDVLYKVLACMTFAAELTEKSGKHPDEKSAMYASGDSVLDSFYADNMDEVLRTNKKRLAVLADAIKASGGEVAEKFTSYYEEAKETSSPSVAGFFGDSVAFRIAAAVVGVLCLITLILYVVRFPSSALNSRIFGFVAKENGPIMFFIILSEIFALIGMSILCVIVGFAGRTKDKKRRTK